MLYDEVVKICQPYLGLAAEAFVNRQIFTNMKLKSADELGAGHLKNLAKWCFHSGCAAMEKELAMEMAKKIMAIEEQLFIKNLFRP